MSFQFDVAQNAVTAIREMAKDKKTAIGQREFVVQETQIKSFRILFDRLKADEKGEDSELLALFAAMDRMLIAAENKKLSNEILCDGICDSLAAEILCQKKRTKHSVETRKLFLKRMKDEAYRFRKCERIDQANAEQGDEESRLSAETYRVLQERYARETEEQICLIREAGEEPEDPEPEAEEKGAVAKEKPEPKPFRDREPLQDKLRCILPKKTQKNSETSDTAVIQPEERDEIPLGGEYCLRTIYVMAKDACCPDLPGYSVMESKEGEIFVGLTEYLSKGKYDNQKGELLRLRLADEQHYLLLSVRLNREAYDLDRVDSADRKKLREYWIFVNEMYRLHLRDRLNVRGLLDFKSYYNCVIREIFESSEEQRRARYIAEEKAEAVLFYLNAYLPDFGMNRKEITDRILSGDTEEVKEQMEQITDEHFTDRESLEEFLRLYESLDSGVAYEAKLKDEEKSPSGMKIPEPSVPMREGSGQIMVPQSFQPQIMVPQPYPVWQMPYAPMPERGIQIVVSYALPSGLIERALFSPNNLNSALELFRNVNSTEVRIGATVREHDLWMLEEKDGTRQDLFTETAFYQIGCSSPEVQLLRMLYKCIVEIISG